MAEAILGQRARETPCVVFEANANAGGELNEMLIVDSQVHLWRTGRHHEPDKAHLLPFPHHLTSAVFDVDDLLPVMDAAGVDRAVLCPPPWDPDYSFEVAKSNPNKFAIMARLELDDPKSRDLVEGWRSRPGMLGVRLSLNDENEARQAWLLDGKADWFWPVAEREGLPVMLLAPKSLPQVKKIAQGYPGLKLIVDHLALVKGMKTGAGAFLNIRQLLDLAVYDNVAVKASSTPFYSSDPYPFRSIEPQLKEIFEAYGPDRYFWGSDISKLKCTYRECVTHFTEALPFLSEGDKELVMGRAICKWLKWDVPT